MKKIYRGWFSLFMFISLFLLIIYSWIGQSTDTYYVFMIVLILFHSIFLTSILMNFIIKRETEE